MNSSSSIKDILYLYIGPKHFYPGQEKFTEKECFTKQTIANKSLKSSVSKIKRFIEQRQETIVNDVNKHIGCGYVSFHNTKEKVTYIVNCPYYHCEHKSSKIDSHLQSKYHRWSKNDALYYKSRQVRLFNYYTHIFSGDLCMPLPCTRCPKYYDRLSIHLAKHGLEKPAIVIESANARRKYIRHTSKIMKLLENR